MALCCQEDPVLDDCGDNNDDEDYLMCIGIMKMMMRHSVLILGGAVQF